MRKTELSTEIRNKYILCSCEGAAEERIVELLVDNDKLFFSRSDLVDGKCTRIRQGTKLANEFLNRDYGWQGITILRILDRPKEKLALPREYASKNIPVFDIITKPEIEILHILAENWQSDFDSAVRHNRNLKPSEFCKARFSRNLPKKIRSVKSAEFIDYEYGQDIDKLTKAIERYAQTNTDGFTLNDLLKN